MLLVVFTLCERMRHSCLERKEIQFNLLPVPILYSQKQMDSSLGAAGCLLLLLQRLSLWFVMAGGHITLPAGRRQPLLTMHKAECDYLLSRSLRALQTKRAIAVLSLQLPGHRPCSLHPEPACSVLRGLWGAAAWDWLVSAVLSLVE